MEGKREKECLTCETDPIEDYQVCLQCPVRMVRVRVSAR